MAAALLVDVRHLKSTALEPLELASARVLPALRGSIVRVSAPVIFALGLSVSVRADCPLNANNEPLHAGTHHGDPASEKFFRINLATADDLPGISLVGFRGAVVQAADTWNNNANARHFRIGGWDARTEMIPASKADCDAEGVNFSQVIVLPAADAPSECSGTFACASGRCVANNIATQSVVVLVIDAGITFGVGAPQANLRDLASTMTHEFGHVANLTHPTSGFATMGSGFVQSTRRRDLYNYDIECARDAAQFRGDGTRNLFGYSRSLTGGTFGSEVPFSQQGNLADVGAGRTLDGQAWVDSTAQTRSWGQGWAKGMFTLPTTVGSVSHYVSIGPTDGVRREDPDNQEFLYAEHLDFPTNVGTASHSLLVERSATEFATSTSSFIQVCGTMDVWMKCHPNARAVSSERIAMAWANGNYAASHPNGVSVMAWTGQTRQEDAADREIRVAIGLANGNALPVPDNFALRSNVAPGLACKTNFSSTYDCVLLYVDSDSVDLAVKAIRFSIAASGLRFAATKDPNGPYLVRDAFTAYTATTGSGVAVTYNGSAFIAVVRSAVNDQPLEAFTSTNGMVWSKLNVTLGYSAVAPSFQSAWQDITTNRLVYARQP